MCIYTMNHPPYLIFLLLIERILQLISIIVCFLFCLETICLFSCLSTQGVWQLLFCFLALTYILHTNMQRFRSRNQLFLHFLASKSSPPAVEAAAAATFAVSASRIRPFLGYTTFPWSKGCNSRISFLIRNMSSSTSSLSVEEQMASETRIQHIEVLSTTEDSYGGVTVDMMNEANAKDPEVFIPSLRASLIHWTLQGKQGVWIKLPITLSTLVDPIVKEGFRYHHAEADYLMLVKWLPDTPDTLPVNASHRVGVGAFVVNENKEVLVVKERTGGFKGSGCWKLPTGVVNQGEDLWTAAIREVKEETGIDTEFVEILAFRQSHRSFFGKSDIFFVCMLRPLSCGIQKQDTEVEAAQWMAIQDYVDQPYNKDHHLFKYVAEICKIKSERDYAGFPAVPTTSASGKITYLYFNHQDFNKM